MNDVVLFASGGVLIDPIATAQPPRSTTRRHDTTADTTRRHHDRRRHCGASGVPTNLGSNGWAIGAAASESDGGMLLANPHFPWEGEKRLWESQLTLTTGELNVYGVTLTGAPGVLIGFNDAVAWTHTVSAGYRMTLYELDLDPVVAHHLPVRHRDQGDDLGGDHRRGRGRRRTRRPARCGAATTARC